MKGDIALEVLEGDKLSETRGQKGEVFKPIKGNTLHKVSY